MGRSIACAGGGLSRSPLTYLLHQRLAPRFSCVEGQRRTPWDRLAREKGRSFVVNRDVCANDRVRVCRLVMRVRCGDATTVDYEQHTYGVVRVCFCDLRTPGGVARSDTNAAATLFFEPRADEFRC